MTWLPPPVEARIGREEAARGAEDGERERVLPDGEDRGERRDRHEEEERHPRGQQVIEA